MSSSESDFEIEENSCLGYQYEPEYTEEELNAQSVENASNNTQTQEESIRQIFCLCGNCENLSSIRESLCCKEFKHYDENYITEEVHCISQHPQFDLICLNKTVLETAYVSFMRYKRLGGRAPDSLTMRQSRLMAYRQFLCWVRRGQPLGKKHRVVLPACAVLKIRKSFPEESGQYEGFHSESSESDSD